MLGFCDDLRRRLGAARLWSDRRGATAVEYGLIIAVVVVTMLIGLVPAARLTLGTWTKVNTQVTAPGNN